MSNNRNNKNKNKNDTPNVKERRQSSESTTASMPTTPQHHDDLQLQNTPLLEGGPSSCPVMSHSISQMRRSSSDGNEYFHFYLLKKTKVKIFLFLLKRQLQTIRNQ